MLQLLIILFFLISIIFLIWNSKKGWVNNKAKQLKVKQIIKSATQWAYASREDKNFKQSLVHASFALAYLNVARTLMSDLELIEMYPNFKDLVQFLELNHKNTMSKNDFIYK